MAGLRGKAMSSKMIKMRDGVSLYCEITQSDSPNWIVWVHGICEHLGRYPHMEELFSKNFNILKFDLRGHGKSQGQRAYIENFEQFIEDLDEVLNFLKTNYNSPQYALMGHSMGALIVSGYMQNMVSKQYYPQVIFLNSPPAGVPGFGGAIARITPQGITKFLSSLKIGVNLTGLVDLKGLSHNPKIGADYVKDKLNSLIIHSKLMFNLLNYSKLVFSKPLRASCPIFIAVGSKDRVVCPQTIISFCRSIDTSIKLKVIDGAYHELHNETEEYRLPYFKFMKECITTQF